MLVGVQSQSGDKKLLPVIPINRVLMGRMLTCVFHRDGHGGGKEEEQEQFYRLDVSQQQQNLH